MFKNYASIFFEGMIVHIFFTFAFIVAFYASDFIPIEDLNPQYSYGEFRDILFRAGLIVLNIFIASTTIANLFFSKKSSDETNY